MKKIRYTACFYSLLLLLNCICSEASAQNYSEEVQSKIQQVENNLAGSVKIAGKPDWNIQERMNYYNVKGVSIAVIKGFKIEWVKGYGWADEEKGIPVTPQTMFQAGQITELANAVGVLKLAQEGKLDLTADINEYLKSWKFPYNSVSQGKKINMIKLLSHGAGVSPIGFLGYQRNLSIPSLTDILNGTKPANNEMIRAVSPPTALMRYSSGGVLISQKVIEDITGTSYQKYMKQNVLRPLNMTHSTFQQVLPRSKEKRTASGYYESGKPVSGKYLLYPEQAAMGLWTTPTDLSKLLIEIQLAYSKRPSKLLSEEMAALQLKEHTSNVGLGNYRNGWNGTLYFTSWGHPEGFNSMYFSDREDGDGVIIMTNTTMFHSFLREVVNSVAAVYKWKDIYTPEIKTTKEIPNSILRNYIGTYTSDRHENFQISLKGNSCWIRLYNINTEVYFTSETDFFTIEPAAEGSFYKGDDGRVAGLKLKSGASIISAKKEL